MFPKVVSVILICALLSLTQEPLSAAPGTSQTQPEKVKAELSKRGIGKKVTVRMQDGSSLKGAVAQIGDETFSLTDSKTGLARFVKYQDVQAVKGAGLSRGAKIGMAIGVIVGVVVILAVVAARNANVNIGRID